MCVLLFDRAARSFHSPCKALACVLIKVDEGGVLAPSCPRSLQLKGVVLV